MKSGLKTRKAVALLAFALALAFALGLAPFAPAQATGASASILSPGDPGIPPADPSQIVREIYDPHLGIRWLLMRDPDHAGGPGRLVMAAPIGAANEARPPGGPASAAGASQPPPVIRAGERLVVEENSPLVEAHLEAVALGPAAIGSVLEVRLKIGGLIVRAVALAPGRAMLGPANGARQ